MKKDHVKLSEQDQLSLHDIVTKGAAKARTQTRARALLQLNEGLSYKAVAQILGVQQGVVSKWGKKYETQGLNKALYDADRPGRPSVISGEARAKITALACADPPEGYSQWSLRMLASHAVELDFCQGISHNHVGVILKKTNSNRI